MGIIKEIKMIYTDVGNNNNKFWYGYLYDDGRVETQWGRVGDAAQTKVIGYGEPLLNKKAAEKRKKGYSELNVLEGVKSNSVTNLAEVAKKQITTDSSETISLIEYLAKVNIHTITEHTSLTYDTSKGTFSTPLGVITKDSIDRARILLNDIGQIVALQDFSNINFEKAVNDYFRLVPTITQRRKAKATDYFSTITQVQAQDQILDSLQGSLDMILSSPTDDDKEEIPQLFKAKLHVLNDGKEIDRIRNKFRNTAKSIHESSKLDVKRVFVVEIQSMMEAYEKCNINNNIEELWHGTRSGNLLSLLKSGFIIPPANASYCSGRMFGNGVYFAPASTKSLNYAHGYWGSSGARDNNCFMFLNSIKMGNYYTPKSYSESLPKAGYDSTWAKSGYSGVQNDECIVYNTCQINPNYLIEFYSK